MVIGKHGFGACALFALALVCGPPPSAACAEPVESERGMARIPAGPYLSGDDSGSGYRECTRHNAVCKEAWFADEAPRRSLFISEFFIDTHEVTAGDYARAMGAPAPRNPDHPVTGVSWYEAESYCRLLGKRLPTEAEWEKAALGGESGVYPWGGEAASGRANFCDRRCEKKWRVERLDDGHAEAAPVGSYPANGYGLHDMAGNVYEWVADTYDANYYRKRSGKDPQGPAPGSLKVVRGGSWINYPTGTRPADRTDVKGNKRTDFIGFRCAR